MSSVADLIADLCPNGVEFKTLGEAGTFLRGNGLQKSDLTGSGVPAIHYGQVHTFYGTYASQTISFVDPHFASKLRKAHPGDLVIAATSEDDEAAGKAVAWVGDVDVAVSGDAYIYRHSLEPKYVSYFFQSRQFHDQKRRGLTGTKVRRISGDSLGKIKIPVPPLAVQREIVRILDNFSELEAQLAVALEAERAARKKQYALYRDQLLTFPEQGGVRWVTMPQVATNLDSRRKPVTKAARHAGDYPYYGASGVVDHVSDFIFDGDYLLVSEDGANLLARSTPIAFSISGRTWVNNHAHILEFDTYSARRFVEIYLNSIDLSPYVSSGAQPKLSQASMNKIRLPWPPADEQERIVNILDKFDAVVNDLSAGLAAEIAARRKQYEYYRDRLLTFEEAPA